ncbi:hypothetical protein F5B21DRAFT_30599 [Xylaria acuta]|nr:hypothetical protein F5B21DRAFT_30599 [Xylaria acuta]
MENPFAEFAYRVISGVTSAYNSCQAVVSKMRSGPKETPPDALERSAEWFADVMTDMILDDNGEISEEAIEDDTNECGDDDLVVVVSSDHHGSKHHATIEGHAEETSDWFLVGHGRASHEQTHPVNPAKERHTRDIRPYNRKKHKRYISRIDGTKISGESQQSDKRNCPRDTRGSHAELRNKKHTNHPSSEIDCLMAVSDGEIDGEIHDEMDDLIAHLGKWKVREFQTTVDGEEQPEPEEGVSGLEETTATDTVESSCWGFAPQPAGGVSNPSSSSLFDKILVPGFLGKNLLAKVQGWQSFFKQQANEPDGQEAEKNPPARTHLEEGHCYYTLGEHK